MRFALLSLALVVASPALANDTASSPSNSEAAAGEADGAAPEAKERKICKRFDATASRLGSKKICLTAEQWKQRERQRL